MHSSSNLIPHPQEMPALSKDDARHQQLLDGLHSINAHLIELIRGREPFYRTVAISATVSIDLDYRDRKHVFIFSSNALTLSFEDLGTLALSANTWTDINFASGTRIFAQGQTAIVYVGIMQTDEPIVSSSGKIVGKALSAWASQPTQTAASGADTVLKFGGAGTDSPGHIAVQNNNTINLLYAFDQDSTVAGNQIYILAPGQIIFLDRFFTTFHCNSSAQVAFGGTSGFTVEAFA